MHKNTFPLTYSQVPIDQAKSALQKSIRRGVLWDTIQWTVEIFNTSTVEQYKAVRTNLFNRLLVIAVEDVSPSHIEAILMVWRLIKDHKDDQLNYVTAAAYLCQCKKSRVNDWAVHYFSEEQLADFVNFADPEKIGLDFKQALINKDYILALWLFSGLRVCVNNISGYKYNKALFMVWVALQQLYPDNTYLQELKEIALSTGWRWQDKSYLIYVHIIHVICKNILPDNDRSVKINLVAQPNLELENFISMVLNRQNYVNIPDYAIDMHTHAGRQMRRGICHFVKTSVVLENEDPDWLELSNFYLAKFKADRDIY